MKTVFYTGSPIVVDDETADAILEYPSALADRRLMGTVTLTDHARPGEDSQLVLTVGLGAPLSVRGAPTTSNETSSDIRNRHAALVSAPIVVASDLDPRNDFDFDFDFEDPLSSDDAVSSS